MAFSLSLPHTASAWAHLPSELLHEFRAILTQRPISRPELTPEERTHRIAMDRLLLERSNASLSASHWPL